MTPLTRRRTGAGLALLAFFVWLHAVTGQGRPQARARFRKNLRRAGL